MAWSCKVTGRITDAGPPRNCFGLASPACLLQTCRMALASKSGLRAASGHRPCSVRQLSHLRTSLPRPLQTPPRALDIDWSDPDTIVSVGGVVLGLVCGIGGPWWYINRTERDAERLEELRAMNRATFEATGEYMSDDEIAKIRKPKWTDRREWVDDD